MINPVDNSLFKYYLRFGTEVIEIDQPDGFQAATFKVEQDSDRFGRDLFYLDQSMPLGFYANHVGRNIGSRYLDHAFDRIMAEREANGFEMVIDIIIDREGVQFTVGTFDAKDEKTDGYSYYSVNVIQNTPLAQIKRRFDDTINLLSPKDVNGNYIEPAPTLQFVRRAVPITKKSNWNMSFRPSDSVTFASPFFYSFNRTTQTSEIDQTTASVADVAKWDSLYDWRYFTFAQMNAGGYNWTAGVNGGAMQLIKARTTIQNIKIRIKFKGKCLQTSTNAPGAIDFVFLAMGGTYDFKALFDAAAYQKIVSIPLIYNQMVDIDIDTTVDYNGVILGGSPLFGCFTPLQRDHGNRYYPCTTQLTVFESFVEVYASEVAVDTVTTGVRYIDIIKQCTRFINGLPVEAPSIDQGGEYYDNVGYSRSMAAAATANSLPLVDDTTPVGQLGDVIYNTAPPTSTLPKGRYFWNGARWVAIDDISTVGQIALITQFQPAGNALGQLAFNTSQVQPVGLCYWDGSKWQPLQYQKPFVTSLKDALEGGLLVETCQDYQIESDKMRIGSYADFYPTREIARLDTTPDKEATLTYNDRFKINNVKLSFDTFEQFRLAKASANDVHTEAEWSMPNKLVEDKFERSMTYVRSGYSAQEMINTEVQRPQTAYENDDKVFAVKIVPLPAGTSNNFTRSLYMNFNGSVVILSNRASSESEEQSTFRWTMVGLWIGATIVINGNACIVDRIEPSTLYAHTVAPLGYSFIGDQQTTVIWTYNNVLWQSATTQGFTLIDGIESPQEYPNLDFTLTRILKRWGDYLATAMAFRPLGVVRNLYYRNNPSLITQTTNETTPLIEKADLSDIGTPRITPYLFTSKTKMSFPEAVEFMGRVQTVRGFVRLHDVDGQVAKGYVREFGYDWNTEEVNLVSEQLSEPAIVEIDTTAVDYTYNGAVYARGADWYTTAAGQKFVFLDSEGFAVNNPLPPTSISLNGVVYPDFFSLINALILL